MNHFLLNKYFSIKQYGFMKARQIYSRAAT